MAAQIIGYLTSEDAKAFAAYASECGVDGSALANLLIIRALRLNVSLAEVADERRTASSTQVKVTAHQKHDRLKSEFGDWSSAQGLTPSKAAARLFRTELKVRWLASCLSR